MQTLVGEIGVSRTEINLEGTVFVRGEYWRARSDQPIAAGHRVSILSVGENLVVYVEAV